jgi:hypothetical protein
MQEHFRSVLGKEHADKIFAAVAQELAAVD